MFNIAVKGQTRLSLSRNSLALAAAGDVTVRPARRRIRYVVYVNRDASEVPRSRLILGMQMSADKSRSLHPTPEAGARVSLRALSEPPLFYYADVSRKEVNVVELHALFHIAIAMETTNVATCEPILLTIKPRRKITAEPCLHFFLIY